MLQKRSRILITSNPADLVSGIDFTTSDNSDSLTAGK